MSDTRRHVHELIDLLPPAQLAAVEGLLETIVDPVTAALCNAAVDDEPETEQERIAAAEARTWLQQNGGKGIRGSYAEAGSGVGGD